MNSICLVQFIQHQQKPKISNNKCCQNPYATYWLLQQPAVWHHISNRIQWIQNYAAWVVLMLHKFSHITPAWPHCTVNHQVDFKIALNGQAPAYISRSPTIHTGSCARLTSSSSHSHHIIWNLVVTMYSAVQPQLYGTISPHGVKTAKTVDSFKNKNKDSFYSVLFA